MYVKIVELQLLARHYLPCVGRARKRIREVDAPGQKGSSIIENKLHRFRQNSAHYVVVENGYSIHHIVVSG